MQETPDSIKNYLLTLCGRQRADGYLCLNEQQDILASDGWVGLTNLGYIEHTSKPQQLIPVLEGLLPGDYTVPTVIEHAHVDQDYYFDIHLFYDYAGTWVLFIDKTRSAKLFQEKQQFRLAGYLKNEKMRTGN